jgi:predicted RecB family nuclease
MALRRGVVPGLGITYEILPQSVGYLQLKSPGEIGMSLIGGQEFSWEKHLTEWENLFLKIGDVFSRGTFPPQPYPFSRLNKPDEICATCPHITLCERGLIPNIFERDEEASS